MSGHIIHVALDKTHEVGWSEDSNRVLFHAQACPVCRAEWAERELSIAQSELEKMRVVIEAADWIRLGNCAVRTDLHNNKIYMVFVNKALWDGLFFALSAANR